MGFIWLSAVVITYDYIDCSKKHINILRKSEVGIFVADGISDGGADDNADNEHVYIC